MRFKLDENLSARFVSTLASRGHDVDTAGMEGLGGHPDDNVASAAREANRVLLTQDGDFSDIHRYPPGTHPGIVILRSGSRSVKIVERLLNWFIENAPLEELVGKTAVVEFGRIRLRSAESGQQ